MRELELDFLKAILGAPQFHDQPQWTFGKDLKFFSVHDHRVSYLGELAETNHIARKGGNIVYLLKQPLITVLALK